MYAAILSPLSSLLMNFEWKGQQVAQVKDTKKIKINRDLNMIISHKF